MFNRESKVFSAAVFFLGVYVILPCRPFQYLGKRAAIGIQVQMIRSACAGAEVTTLAQLELALGDMNRKEILWPTSGGERAHKAGANMMRGTLNSYLSQYLLKHVLRSSEKNKHSPNDSARDVLPRDVSAFRGFLQRALGAL